MNLIPKPPSLRIDEKDPFSSDTFDLQEFADALSGLIAKSPESFVINLEAPWGQGKTTFLQMWRHRLRRDHVQSLYFNAWESDFSRDPLIALIGELSAGMAAMRIQADSPAWAQLAKLKKVGARVVVRALPALIKAGTLGVLDLSEPLEEVVACASEKLAEDEIQRYQDAKQSISDFRRELETFATQLAAENGSAAPLVIVVDELDRCRPDYAISILETVKHLFTVPSVVFVVATDSRQLSNAIRHVYGLDAAASDYLRRFFDLAISLPKPSARQFVEALFARHGLEEFFENRKHLELRFDRDQAVAAFVAMFEATNCSLRDQQKCAVLFTISLRTMQENSYLHPLLLCTLVVLRVKRNDLYERFVSGEIGAKDLVDELSQSTAGRSYFESPSGYGAPTLAHLIVSVQSREKRRADEAWLRERAEADEKSADAELARRALEIIQHSSFRNARGALRHILPRLEFISRQTRQDDDSF